ncbi:hypothetical protein SAY87_003478 [Trapa incisa]|uniref:Uncharacterized protein n=2 Tax=Trapa TaxID=22665 RepID=A0AAN7L4S4_TRANT|nr:hypothetical protein SAY87_003478 [Trapa incisa]KAK4779051.1 hypothetical protein SAY86_006579 [Trapa natans]
MANSRLARFVMEAVPPQFVSVMRRQTSKNVLDTIAEEETRSLDSGGSGGSSYGSLSFFSGRKGEAVAVSLPYNSSSATLAAAV